MICKDMTADRRCLLVLRSETQMMQLDGPDKLESVAKTKGKEMVIIRRTSDYRPEEGHALTRPFLMHTRFNGPWQDTKKSCFWSMIALYRPQGILLSCLLPLSQRQILVVPCQEASEQKSKYEDKRKTPARRDYRTSLALTKDRNRADLNLW